MRRGQKGEQIQTFVEGKYETQHVVGDDGSYVVQGVAGESYVLTASNFRESYDESSSMSLESISPTLHRQGFREFRSKRRVWAHQVTKADIDWIHLEDECGSQHLASELRDVAYFVAPWGEAMRVEVGDFLVTQYPAGNDEIYRIERNVFAETYECL